MPFFPLTIPLTKVFRYVIIDMEIYEKSIHTISYDARHKVTVTIMRSYPFFKVSNTKTHLKSLI